ncbi:MAG TPA: ATP-binding protein [Bryobacteraceae bacterium]|nr:ATP-binding protein [Bryobacteraceae bacterium]
MARFSLLQLPVRGRFVNGLRFRLTLTYVVFFALLLSVLGIFFRQTLRSIYTEQTKDLLTEEWAAVKGYLRIDKGNVDWYYDREDPEEAIIVDRLKQIYLLTDSNGDVLEISGKYRELGIETPQEIKRVLKQPGAVWKTRFNDKGAPYLIRSGLLIDDNPHRSFYVAIGRSLAESNRILDQFTWRYFLFLPVMILASVLIGWFMAGRALRPVNDVAETAQRITGSNLAVQIPSRGADDELDRLIEAFNRMIERLESSFTQTRQFSTDVSHELRTPLTAIRGQLEVALFAANTVEQYRDAIVSALEDVERLGQTIRALLLLSQAESGQVLLQKQVLNLTELTADIVDQFQIPAEGAKLTLTANLPPDCLIEVDRIQIERLISNLLSNAVKYTLAGGSIHVAIACHAEHIELSVKDTGVGIPERDLPHIFDRFYRVPDKNPERGLGLGLSFVAWIVKAHGGRIDVQSTLGAGTVFLISLPRAAPGGSPIDVNMAHSETTATEKG